MMIKTTTTVGGPASSTSVEKRKNVQVSLATRPRAIKLIPCSTQLSTKFILLINVKMPTIVGILTFISMINTTSERLKASNFFTFRYFSFKEQLKFHAQLSWAWKVLKPRGRSRPQVRKLFSCSTQLRTKTFRICTRAGVDWTVDLQ